MSTENEIHIRDARPDERHAIRDVTLSGYAQYATIMPHWEMYRKHIVATLEQEGTAARIVAELDGTIVGSVLLYPAGADVHAGTGISNESPELRLLAVAPAAGGRGVGSALLEECVRRAGQMKATSLVLHTEDTMQVAKRMYERRGFVRAPELDFNPLDGLLVKGYRLSLDAEM